MTQFKTQAVTLLAATLWICRYSAALVWGQYSDQYTDRYSKPSYGASASSGETASYLPLPANRSGYSHSGSALGKLSDQGYDDLAEYSPVYSTTGTYRKPQDLLSLDSSSALICTWNTGEFYWLDLNTGEVSAVFQDVKRRWQRMLKLDDHTIAVTDLAEHAVIVFHHQDRKFTQIASLPTPGHPHSLYWDSTSGTLYVSGQWSQRLYRFSAESRTHRNEHVGISTEVGDQATTVRNTADPHQTTVDWSIWKQLPAVDLGLHGGVIGGLPKHKVLVTIDAFGGDFAVWDISEPADQPMRQLNRSTLTGHNVTGFATSDDEQWVVFPFQLLNPETYSVQGDITWGGLISNNLRWVQTQRLLTKQDTEVIKQGKFVPLGQVGNGAGDPTSLQLGPNALISVTLGGIDRVAVGRRDVPKFQQFQVGLHPIDSLFTSSGEQLWVLSEFSDSLTRIDLTTEQIQHIPLGELRQPTLEERGERLFFHSALAHDGWMSCHSCHSRGHTSGHLNDNTSDGSLGTPKRILSLLGQATTAPYSWTGEMKELELQVLNSIQSTMATDFQISRSTVDAITAYIRTLPPPPSVQSARAIAPDSQLIEQGHALFQALSCTNCHAGADYTSPASYDVGLVDQRGLREFNPPSLVGVSQRERSLLHDGQANSIEQLFSVHKHQLTKPLSQAELKSLVAFLSSL